MQVTESLIEVWSAAASSDQPGELERCCETWLTAEERQRAMRFRKETSRNQHIVGRGMTRKLLWAPIAADPPEVRTASASDPLGQRGCSDLAGRGDLAGPVGPSQIEFGFTPHGKPFVIAPAELARPFNVAHTDGMVLFASWDRNPHQQTAGATIGVDVERKSRKTDVALAQRYFAPPEVEYVFDQLDADRRLGAFLRVWTLKEAFIKAIGTGLSMPLGDFAFEQLDSDRPRVRMLDPALGDGEHWQFIAFQPADGYVGALAVCDWPGDRAAKYRLRSFESLLGLSAQPSASGSVAHPAVSRGDAHEPTTR